MDKVQARLLKKIEQQKKEHEKTVVLPLNVKEKEDIKPEKKREKQTTVRRRTKKQNF